MGSDGEPQINQLIARRCGECFDALLNLISNSTERGEPDTLITLDLRWILKTPVDAFGRSGKYRTVLVCVVAHRDYVVEVLSDKPVDIFREVVGDVDSNLFHHLNCFCSHLCWSDAGACHFKTALTELSQ